MAAFLVLHVRSDASDADTLRQARPDQPLTGEFFEDGPGLLLRSYRSCIDFDCFELEKKLKRQAKHLTPALVSLLRFGFPEERASNGVPESRHRVLRLLELYGDSRAEAAVVPLLSSGDPVTRAAAARTLGSLGGRTAVTSLIPLLEDPDQLVRETSAAALGALGHAEALPALRKAAAAERLPHVRRAMEQAISALAER